MKVSGHMSQFPTLWGNPTLSLPEIEQTARLITVKPGQTLFRDGAVCEDLLLIATGSVRIQKLSEGGQVIALARLQAGQVCELSASCLMGGRCYPAEAIAETAVRAIAIPKDAFMEALGRFPDFRKFIFTSIDKSIGALVALVGEVSFGNMDHRLARCILAKSVSQGTLSVTHRELAEELGTAREVVSRLLKKFEQKGWIQRQRGSIRIIDTQSLLMLI